MKYSIILLNILLPVLSFGQFGEPIYDLDFSKIDSVTLVEYRASSIPFPKTKPIKVDGILRADTIAHQKMLKKR